MHSGPGITSALETIGVSRCSLYDLGLSKVRSVAASGLPANVSAFTFGGMRTLRRSNWRIDALIVASIAVFMFDLTQFNGCRCWFGIWERLQGLCAGIILAIVVARFVGAWIFEEKNSGWKYYIVLLISSPFIVRAVFALASLALPAELRVHPPKS